MTSQLRERYSHAVIDAPGSRCAVVELPAGSLPTNVCLGGSSSDELYVTAAHSQALLRVRFDDADPVSPAAGSE
jgi:gluconolactonase